MIMEAQQEKEIRRGVIGREERFCDVGVYLSRDEDDELESLEKGVGGRIKG